MVPSSDSAPQSPVSQNTKLCTFYQQSGGCSKENCRFTHVRARDEFKDSSARVFFRNIPDILTVDIIADCVAREYAGEFFVFKNYAKHIAHVVFKTWDLAQPLIDRGYLNLPSTTGKLTYMVNVPDCGFHEWNHRGPFLQEEDTSSESMELRRLKSSFRAEKDRLVELHIASVSELQSKHREKLDLQKSEHAAQIACLTEELEKQSERGIREFRRSLVTEHVLARSSLRGQLEKMEKENELLRRENERLKAKTSMFNKMIDMDALRENLKLTSISPAELFEKSNDEGEVYSADDE